MQEQGYIVAQMEKGSVHVAEEVLATIVYESIKEVEGVGGFATSLGGEIAERLGKVKKASSKNVKIRVEGDGTSVAVFLFVQYGHAVNAVAKAVQQAAITAVSDMLDVTLKAVNVTICGIAFDKPEKPKA